MRCVKPLVMRWGRHPPLVHTSFPPIGSGESEERLVTRDCSQTCVGDRDLLRKSCCSPRLVRRPDHLAEGEGRPMHPSFSSLSVPAVIELFVFACCQAFLETDMAIFIGSKMAKVRIFDMSLWILLPTLIRKMDYGLHIKQFNYSDLDTYQCT